MMRGLLLTLVLLPAYLEAGWTILPKRFNQPVSCGFFFDGLKGLVGTGSNDVIGSPEIWLTTDGGETWLPTRVPATSSSRLTNIFMKDRSVGYASVMSQSSSNKQALWKTTDGGATWVNFTQGHRFSASCVYATSSALIVSSWDEFGGRSGGSSTNEGQNFQQSFAASGSGQTNGIDFADDLQGVVAPGPAGVGWFGNDQKNPCLYTLDGGRTWQEGGDLSESWGMFAIKGTTTFIALPEGFSGDTQVDVCVSTNTGRTWTVAHSFPQSYDFTGHIAGQGNTIYVQSESSDNRGMFRSDDRGNSWKNVGGPSNNRDTRFCVTGCGGEIVFAFDDNGRIWKTLDGGDSTLLVEQVRIGQPESLGGKIESFYAGDTVRIPIYALNGVRIIGNSYHLRLKMNTDLLEPFDVSTIGTLSSAASQSSVVTDSVSASVTVSFPNPATITVNTQSPLPLCYVLARVYLTRDTTTDVVLDSFSVQNQSLRTNLFTCSNPLPIFTLEFQCGDSTIRQLMKGTLELSLNSVRPNPTTTGMLELEINSARDAEVVLEVINTLGVVVKQVEAQRLPQGTSHVLLPVMEVPSGIVYIRLRSANGVIQSNPIAIVR